MVPSKKTHSISVMGAYKKLPSMVDIDNKRYYGTELPWIDAVLGEFEVGH